jgi:NitT/TauT family transport system substrate-binding protein
MKLSLRRSIAVISCAALLVSSGGASAADKVKIILSATVTVLSAPFFVAKDKGYFDEYGLDVSIDSSLENMSDTLPLLATGQYSLLATSWGASVFNAMQRNNLIRVIGTRNTLPTSGPSPMEIVVSAKEFDAGLKTAAGLKGRKLGVVGLGGLAEYQIVVALKEVGLSASDVEMVPLRLADLGPAIANGSVVGGWASEPVSTLLAKSNIAKPIASDALRGHGVIPIFANGDFALKNPDACAKFLAAFLKAARRLDGGGWHDPELLKIVSSYTKMAPELLEAIAVVATPADLKPDFRLASDTEDYLRGKNLLTYQGKLDFTAFYSQAIVDQALALAGQ